MAPRSDFWHRYVLELSRFRPDSTLELLAGMSQYAYREREFSGNKVADWEEKFLQHTFAHDNIARDVILRSSLKGSVIPRTADIERLCNRYLNLGDPVLRDKTHKGIERYTVRIAYEQFRYQLSPYGELCRSWALFGETGAQFGASAMNADAWRSSLGCDLQAFLRIIFCLEIFAGRSGGVMKRDSLDWNVVCSVAPGLNKTEFSEVLRNLTSTISANRKYSPPPLKGYEKYSFNPLASKPLILKDDCLIVPSAFLLMQRAWSNNLYYDRVGDEEFRNQIGGVFEAYVGRQLKQLETNNIAQVHPEIKYFESGEEWASTDWLVVFPHLVLLVEAKAGRLREPSRLGLDDLEKDVERTLGIAYQQLERSARIILGGNPAFVDIPMDRPLLGFAVTLDPFWLFNDPIQSTPRPFDMEIHPVGIHEIEVLIQAALAGPIESALAELCVPADNQARRVRRVLADCEQVGNPILDSAFNEIFPDVTYTDP